jgi:translation elongation factor EF-1alpha
MHHKRVEKAGPGDNVGMNIKGLDKGNMPRTGDVMILKSDATLKQVKDFTAQIQTLDIPGEVKAGYSPIGFVRCGRSACRITGINWKVRGHGGGGEQGGRASRAGGQATGPAGSCPRLRRLPALLPAPLPPTAAACAHPSPLPPSPPPHSQVGKETGGKKLEAPHSLKANEMAEVVFEPCQPLVVDSFKNCEGLSRIAFLDGNTAVMLGKVVKTTSK